MTNKRRSSQQWRELLESHLASELSVAEFCRREELSEASFYQWRKRLAAEKQSSELFAPLSVASSAVVEIELPGGAVLRVPPGDERSLRCVVDLLTNREPPRHD